MSEPPSQPRSETSLVFGGAFAGLQTLFGCRSSRFRVAQPRLSLPVQLLHPFLPVGLPWLLVRLLPLLVLNRLPHRRAYAALPLPKLLPSVRRTLRFGHQFSRVGVLSELNPLRCSQTPWPKVTAKLTNQRVPAALSMPMAKSEFGPRCLLRRRRLLRTLTLAHLAPFPDR